MKLQELQKQTLWQEFAQKYGLSPHQLEQFQKYYLLLELWNERINLTTLTSQEDVIAYHFEDSLQVANFYAMEPCKGIIDVGTGAGLPGIPLKIKYPHIPVVLVEVIQKKVTFLRLVIQELGLEGIEVSDLDWRTFLRQTKYPADLVCARASLRPDELVRMFQGSSPYKQAQLIYWASHDWKLDDKELKFFTKEEKYCVGDKKRKYIFFNSNS